MKAIIVGGGIGGLTTALMLRARGIDCELFEQSDTIRELGVGINTLPHAIRELAGLGLLQKLDDVAIRTDVLYYLNRHGQEVWREARGIDAGHDVPQFSIHRGRLQSVIHRAVEERLGPDAIHTGCRLGAFTPGRGRRHRVFLRSHRQPLPNRARRYPDRRRRHSFAGARDAVSGRRPAVLERADAVARRARLAGVSDRTLDDRRRRPPRQGRGLSDRGRIEPGEPADQLGGAGEDRRRQCAAAAPRGLVAARQARGTDAACRAVLGALCRRAQPDLGDAGILRISDLRPRSACRIGRAAASRCSAMPRIRCIRSAPTAPRRRFSTRARWPTRWRVPNIRARR